MIAELRHIDENFKFKFFCPLSVENWPETSQQNQQWRDKLQSKLGLRGFLVDSSLTVLFGIN